MKLVVEVLNATNLPARDGQGSSSPYVEVEFENQRLRTTTKNKDQNPVWNETLEFNISDIGNLSEEDIHVSVYTSKKSRGQRGLLGRTVVEGFKVKAKDASQAHSYVLGQGLFALFSNKGEITLNAYYNGSSRNAEVPKKDNSSGGGKKSKLSRSADVLISSAIDKPKSGDGGNNNKNATQSFSPPPAPNFSVKETKVEQRRHEERLRKNRHDLVTEVKYLFVRIEKARELPAKDITGKSDPYVEVKFGNAKCRTEVIPANLNPYWDEVFAFSWENQKAQNVEIIVKDKDMVVDDFIGCLHFDVDHIPERYPPDSPLALQWYNLESRRSAAKNGGDAPSAASSSSVAANYKDRRGEIMLAVWIGNQTDESFPRSKHSSPAAASNGSVMWNPSFRSAVYVTPRLWYLRVCVMEARDLFVNPPASPPSLLAIVELVKVGGRAQLFQTKPAAAASPAVFTWKPEEATFYFVAAEPFHDQELVVVLKEKVSQDKEEVIGGLRLRIAVEKLVERRTDYRVEPKAKWFEVEREARDFKEMATEVFDKIAGNDSLPSRIKLSAVLDGGYHVLDEMTQYTSDVNPADRRYGRNPVAVLELGIRSATELLPMKNGGGGGATANAYCVAKYGRKWIRTRTVPNSLAPTWHEQYVWDVHDPCTVLTVCVFHNCNLGGGGNGNGGKNGGPTPDAIIGKVRIRLSTLDGGRSYGNAFPLIALESSGLKKRGEIELVIRLTSIRQVSLLLSYIKPLLPRAHYASPMSVRNIEILRGFAMSIVEARLLRSDPPLPSVAFHFLLDTSQASWSWRRIRVNLNRIFRILDSVLLAWNWLDDVRRWRRPVTTLFVHVLYIILCLSPDLILPTIFFYMFLIGLWQYRYRPPQLAHMDVKLSMADVATPEELAEEFDSSVPSKENRLDTLRFRYDRMKLYGARVQNVIGDLAGQLERFAALLSWRDRRATAIFVCFCFCAAVILYVIPPFVMALIYGIYWMRHPKLRRNGSIPPPPLNFFRRLPPLSDTVF